MAQILEQALLDFQPLQWDDVLKAIDWDPNCPETIPVPHNSVLTVQLNNSKVTESQTAYQLNAKFNRSQFAWIRWKYINPRATILNYPNKCIVVGATTPNRAFYCVLGQIRLFEESGTHIYIQEPATINNIVLAATLGSSLDIARLASQHPSRINYAPSEFSGATFTPFSDQALSGCKGNIFELGAYTILGATSMRQAVVISKLTIGITMSFRVEHWQRISKVGERELERQQHKQQADARFEEKEAARSAALAALLNTATVQIQKNIIRTLKSTAPVEEF